MKPKCNNCGKDIPPYLYRANGPRPHNPETLALIKTADGGPPQFGPMGNNAFCSVSCGFRWAITRVFKAHR